MSLDDSSSDQVEMKRRTDVAVEYARRGATRHQLKFSVMENGFSDARTVTRTGIGPLITRYGRFQMYSFSVDDDWQKYSALVLSKKYENHIPIFSPDIPLLLRIDSGCETGQLFGDLTCECVDQLHLGLYEISLNGQGVLINIPHQDGRGMGLPFKLATLFLQDELGVDTVQSSLLFEPDGDRDRRTYSGALSVLQYLGVRDRNIHLNTNNPAKKKVFVENSYTLTDVPSVIPSTMHTAHHLKAKHDHLGHESIEVDDTDGDEASFKSLLSDSIARSGGYLCCGLDPDIDRIPKILTETFSPDIAASTFCAAVVDQTYDIVAGYKIQKAFFDRLPNGDSALKATIRHIRKIQGNLPIILDCKVGDIDNTMHAYLSYFFNDLKVDAVVVNPFMGTDVLAAFDSFPNKAALVLVRTSNEGASIVQDVKLSDGRPLWRMILDLTLELRSQGKHLHPILGRMEPSEFEELAAMSAGEPLFLAGIGTQGGDASILKSCKRHSIPTLVNVSRAILFGDGNQGTDWKTQIRERALSFRDSFNQLAEGQLK